MKNRRLRDSFANAFRGIEQAFITETNVKIHTFVGILIIILSVLLGITIYEWIIVIFAITFVLTSELLNTAVEYAIDMVCGNTYHEIAKYAKDIAAGATLIAAVGAMVAGILVFTPYILQLLNL